MRRILEKLLNTMYAQGVAVFPINYYTPFVRERDLRLPLDLERNLPGLNLNLEVQRGFLSELTYTDELLDIPVEIADDMQYYYSSPMVTTHPHRA